MTESPESRTWRFWTINDARAVLVGAGIVLAAIGGIVLLNDIPPRQYPAIVAWLVAVLIAHDVIIAGVVCAVAVAGRRAQMGMPLPAILIVQGALAVAGIMALIVVPEIVKKASGTANPSVLPLPYAGNLALLLAALALAAAAAIALQALWGMQRRDRSVSR